MEEVKRYWVFCLKCEEYYRLDQLREKKLYADSFKDFMLFCPCGNQQFGIEKTGNTYHDFETE